MKIHQNPSTDAKEPFVGYGLTAGQAYRRRLMDRLGLKKAVGKKAVDLGCGEGYLAGFLADLGYRVDAVDLAPHPLWPEIARQHQGRVKFHRGDAQKFRSAAKSYDLVFEKDMLHHAQDPLAALKEMARLARPGGQVVVVEANRLNPVFYLHLTLMGNHQHFTRRRLLGLAQNAGLTGATLKLAEARAFPVNRGWFQALFEWTENLVEKVPFFRPFICYHLLIWRKP